MHTPSEEGLQPKVGVQDLQLAWRVDTHHNVILVFPAATLTLSKHYLELYMYTLYSYCNVEVKVTPVFAMMSTNSACFDVTHYVT